MDYATLFPEMDAIFSEGGAYPTYTYEAHRVVTAKGYEKILFRITGDTDKPDFKADKGPVLYVAGATTNVLSSFDTDLIHIYSGNFADIGANRATWATNFEAKLSTLLAAEDDETKQSTSFLLGELQTRIPESKWTELTKAWKKAKLPWEDILAIKDTVEVTEEIQECVIGNYATNEVDQYLSAMDGDQDSLMPAASDAF